MATPEAFYRRPIDLNRFSNSVSREIILSYNEVILEIVQRLKDIDEINAPYTAARMRSLLAQLRESLNSWSINSATVTTRELQGLAALQTEFVEDQLKRLLPAGSTGTIRSVEVTPDFARSVVMTDPTEINVFTLPDEIEDSVLTGLKQPTFRLSSRKGSIITLPNGETVAKAFRGISQHQVDLFAKTVRTGMLAGDSTQKIGRKLLGRLYFENAAKGSVSQIAKRGGLSTRMANHQVMTIVRTSVNQVANTASLSVYEANQDITKQYEYVATLDSKTSAICARLDGQKFAYDKGPTPPQHFNCRSTTVPVIDWSARGLGDPPKATRPAKWGEDQKGKQVPADMNYADWLRKQPLSVQEKVFGKWKAQYFRDMSKKEGPTSALRKIVRADGSELTLGELKNRYPSLPASKNA